MHWFALSTFGDIRPTFGVGVNISFAPCSETMVTLTPMVFETIVTLTPMVPRWF
jgi:hypothetical protein